MRSHPHAYHLKKLGKSIRKMRLKHGMTQDELEDHGISYKYYQDIEAGKANISYGTLVKLSKAFRCLIHQLIPRN